MSVTLARTGKAIRNPAWACRAVLGRLSTAICSPPLVRRANAAFGRAVGGESRPKFFDIDRIYPSLREIDRNAGIIRAELNAILARKDDIPRYHDLDATQTYISGVLKPEKDWKVFMLYTLAGTPQENQARCPRTTALVRRIPHLNQAFFSILDPGKPVPAHCGPYLGYLRYHLALIVPDKNPPRIRIKDQWYTWKNGESVMFDDSHEHEVENRADSMRVVLIVDVLRPLPWHLHLINWFITQVVYQRSAHAEQTFAQIQKYQRR